MNPAPDKDNIIKAIAHVCVAFFLFTAMSAFNKSLTGLHHPAEIMFYRNLLGFVLLGGYVLARQNIQMLKIKSKIAMFARAFIGTLGLILTLAATQELPMSTATVLFFCSTLITPILAVIFLQEKIHAHRITAIILGMVGVIIVAQPSTTVSILGITLALFAGASHAIIQVLLRKLRNESTFAITFYFFAGGVVLGGLALPFVGQWPTEITMWPLLGVAITGCLGQYFLTKGFAIGEASMLSPFNYTGLLWAVLFDATIFGIIPQQTTFIGAALIISANLYIIYRERKNKTKHKTTPTLL